MLTLHALPSVIRFTSKMLIAFFLDLHVSTFSVGSPDICRFHFRLHIQQSGRPSFCVAFSFFMVPGFKTYRVLFPAVLVELKPLHLLLSWPDQSLKPRLLALQSNETRLLNQRISVCVILEIRLNLERKLVCVTVYMYIITASCWRHALQPRSLPPFYPDSVGPELARRHAVCKWPNVARIRAFHGGLQARLWQAKIGLRSFITRFLQAAHKVAGENSFALREVRHAVVDLRVCTKQVRRK